MSLAVFRFFLDIQDKRTGRFQDAQELLGTFQKPINILLRLDTAVRMLAAVGVRWRSDD